MADSIAITLPVDITQAMSNLKKVQVEVQKTQQMLTAGKTLPATGAPVTQSTVKLPRLSDGPYQRQAKAYDNYLRANVYGDQRQQIDAQLNLLRATNAVNHANHAQFIQSHPPLADGPYQRQAKAYNNLLRANVYGNQRQQLDAQLNYMRATRAADKATRDQLGGDASIKNKGALNDLMSAFGKLSTITGVVTLGFMAVKEAMDSLLSQLGDYVSTRNISGASPQEAAFMKLIGQTLPQSLSGRQMAQMAKGITRAMGTNPYAQMNFGYALPEELDPNVDQAARLKKVIDTLRAAPSRESAILKARSLGVPGAEDLVALRDLSDQQYQKLWRMAGDDADFMDSRKFLHGFMTQRFNTAALKNATLGEGARALGTEMANNSENSTDIHYIGANGMPYTVKGHTPTYNMKPLMPDPGTIGGGMASDHSASAVMVGALNQNAQATNNLVIVMKQMREVMGGGAIAQRALPSSWRYWGLDVARQGMARDLGAFGYL